MNTITTTEYSRVIQERDDALSREMAERAARVALQDENSKLQQRINELVSLLELGKSAG